MSPLVGHGSAGTERDAGAAPAVRRVHAHEAVEKHLLEP